MACDPNDLSKSASCFQCLDAKQLAMVQAYALAVIAGASTDPNALVTAAGPFQALSEQQLSMVQVYLLCQILGG
jgi:hypothetical protein